MAGAGHRSLAAYLGPNLTHQHRIASCETVTPRLRQEILDVAKAQAEPVI